MIGRLDNGILFRVEASAELVPLAGSNLQSAPGHNPTSMQWLKPYGGAIISCGEDAFILDDEGTQRSASDT